MSHDEEVDDQIVSAILAGNNEPVRMLVNVLSRAAQDKESKLFKEYTENLHFALIGLEGFPGWLFTEVLAVLRKPAFLRLEGSWHLLVVFELVWDQLSQSQKNELLSVLESIYPLCTDWTSCFTISGLLGEYFKDEQAFDVLCRLQEQADEIPRKFVPHGFEHLVKDCLDRDLAQRALSKLLQMRGDPSPNVQAEAEESLTRLKARGFTIPSG